LKEIFAAEKINFRAKFKKKCNLSQTLPFLFFDFKNQFWELFQTAALVKVFIAWLCL
jgi:hypothetical protein